MDAKQTLVLDRLRLSGTIAIRSFHAGRSGRQAGRQAYILVLKKRWPPVILALTRFIAICYRSLEKLILLGTHFLFYLMWYHLLSSL